MGTQTVFPNANERQSDIQASSKRVKDNGHNKLKAQNKSRFSEHLQETVKSKAASKAKPKYSQDLAPKPLDQDNQITEFPSGFLAHILPSLTAENADDPFGEDIELDGLELQYQLLIQNPEEEQNTASGLAQGQPIATEGEPGDVQDSETADAGRKLAALEADDATPSPAKDLKEPKQQAISNSGANSGTTTSPVQATASPTVSHAQFAAQVTQASQSATAHAHTPQSTGPNLAEHVGLQIAQQAQAGQNRFTIRLDPPELGRIDIQMTVRHDGTVQATLSVDNENTFDLLQRDQRGLERTLENAGLKADSGGLNFSLKQQNGDQMAGGHQSRFGHGEYADSDEDAELAAISSMLAEKIVNSSRPLDITI